MANQRRKRIIIEALQLEDEVWSYDTNEIMQMGSKFFENLYTEEGSQVQSLHFGLGFPQIEDDVLCRLGEEC